MSLEEARKTTRVEMYYLEDRYRYEIYTNERDIHKLAYLTNLAGGEKEALNGTRRPMYPTYNDFFNEATMYKVIVEGEDISKRDENVPVEYMYNSLLMQNLNKGIDMKTGEKIV